MINPTYEEQFLEAFNQKDATKMQACLESYDYQNPPSLNLSELRIRELHAKDIPFLKLFDNFQTWNTIGYDKSLLSGTSIVAIFNCPELLTYFHQLSEKTKLPWIHHGYIHIKDSNVIPTYFDLNMHQVSDTPPDAPPLSCHNEQIFLYGIKNNLITLTTSQSLSLYLSHVLDFNPQALDHIIALNPLIKEKTVTQILNYLATKEQFTFGDVFYFADSEKLKNLFKNHPIQEKELHQLLELVFDYSPKYDHFIPWILNYTKEHQPDIFEAITNPAFFKGKWFLDNRYELMALPFILDKELSSGKPTKKNKI